MRVLLVLFHFVDDKYPNVAGTRIDFAHQLWGNNLNTPQQKTETSSNRDRSGSASWMESNDASTNAFKEDDLFFEPAFANTTELP